jgi:hypothetical protein
VKSNIAILNAQRKAKVQVAEIDQSESVQDLIHTVQCQYCLYCTKRQRQCRLDPNFGKCETKLVENCTQVTIAGEDT